MIDFMTRLNNFPPYRYTSRMLHFCKRAGVEINLEHPTTLQDKIAYLNIYHHYRLKTKCADKVAVKLYAKCVLGEDICPKTLDVCFTPEDINWKILPSKVMIKCNHGCGMNIMTNGLSDQVIDYITPSLNKWMQTDYAFVSGFEAHYHDITRCIFAEELLGDGEQALIDYKFLCFNGEPKFMQVISGRNTRKMRMNYYDMDMQPCKGLSRTDIRADYSQQDVLPTQFDTMKEYSRKLAEPFKFVRVDFYEVDGRVYLGEMTFTPAACGFRYVNPKEDQRMGSYLEL